MNSLPINAKPIPDYPTYYATPEGEIWRDTLCNSHKRDDRGVKRRITKLKDRYNSKIRYCQVQPYKNGKKGCTYTHRLVLAAFKGWPPKGYECNHIDGNTQNNQLSNLEWIPKEENLSFIKRKPKSGPNSKKYTRKAKLKWKEFIPKIINLRNKGKNPKEIAFKLGIPINVVYLNK